MAEKYGTIPPRFTKEWWGYIWYYYKWWFVGIGFAILCLLFTAVQCATRQHYDVTITYSGVMMYSDQDIALMEETLSDALIEDADGDGEKKVHIQQLNVTNEKANIEYDSAIRTKVDLELQLGENNIFIFDKTELEYMLDRDHLDEIFMHPGEEWAKNVDKSRFYEVDGKPYAVNLAESKILNDAGLNSEDMYILLHRSYDESEEGRSMYAVTAALAETLAE